MEILPNIHRIDLPLGQRSMAMHLLIDEERVWLVDLGIADTPPLLMDYVRQSGPHHVAGAIITHPDADHCGGLGLFHQMVPDAIILAHACDAAVIQSPERCLKDRYDFASPYGFVLDDIIRERIRRNLGTGSGIDWRLVGGEVLCVGGRAFEVIHAPGHSAGHVVLWDAKHSAVILTDAVLSDFIPTSDGKPMFAPTYRYLKDYLATIERIRDLEPELLLPTHFPPVAGAESVAAFLRCSEQFTMRVEAELMQVLSKRELRLREIIDLIGNSLGEWVHPDDPFVRYSLCYPLAAHLDAAVCDERVRVALKSSVATYTLS